MTPWSVRNTFDILVIGQRLAILLFAVAAYYVVAGVVIQTFAPGDPPGKCRESDEYTPPGHAAEFS